jgi:hypothetical protein
MNSASLCSLTGRYPIPTRFLASIDCLKIPAPLPSPMAGLQRQYFWTGCGGGGGGKSIHGTNGTSRTGPIMLKVRKIELFFGFDFEICIVSLLVMSKY